MLPYEMKYYNRKKPKNDQKESAKDYQRLFDFFSKEHGLTLIEGELDDIIHEVNEHEKRMEAKYAD